MDGLLPYFLGEKWELKYGREGDREWWESWRGKKGIVIQRWRKGEGYGRYWGVFLIRGKTVRTSEEVFKDLLSAVRFLKNLGLEVEMKEV